MPSVQTAAVMPPLLAKLKRLRHRRRSTPAKSSSHEWRHHRWFWAAVVLAVVVVLGAFFWVTSARLLKDPIRIDYGPLDPTFPAAMGPIVGAEFTAANRVRTLVNGDQFFPAMLQAIREAKKTITLESYIWSSGFISNKFIDALGERASHGVKVHVLVDGVGAIHFRHVDRDRLRASGVELYVYGREHWYEIKPNINHRTHRKLLIIDGKIGFAGGMCIDDKWLGHADSPHVWRETEVELEGPVVREMQAVFAANWMQTTSSLLLGEGYFPKMTPVGDADAQAFKSGPGEGPQNARLAYLFAIAAARKTIDISHAYFVPDDLAVEMLLEARQRGVRIRVLVPAINDSRIGRAASRSRWGELLAHGVEFYRYEPAMFHCKTMVIDDVLVTVGSANFDNRSFSINDEVTVNILNRDVAAEQERIFAHDLSQSQRLTEQEFEARPFYIKLADRACGLLRSQL